MANYLPILAAAVAVLGFVATILTRRKLQETQALLADTATRFDVLTKHSKQIEQQAKSQQELADKLRQQASHGERQLDEVKLRLHEKSQEVDRFKQEQSEQLRRVNLQKDHLGEQVQAMAEQLAEAVRDKKAALVEAQRLQKELEGQESKMAEQLRTQVREVQQQMQGLKREKQQLESQLQKLKAETVTVSPEELKKYRTKVTRLEQLYTSMKGLRDMAEERNQNWETALRYFATHVLEGKANASVRPIGPLVGEALEKIGATLLLESASEAARAERAFLSATETVSADL